MIRAQHIVPLFDNKILERVCDNCYDKLQSQTLLSIFENNNFSTQRTHLTEYATNNNNDSASHDSFGRLLINTHIPNFICFFLLHILQSQIHIIFQYQDVSLNLLKIMLDL